MGSERRRTGPHALSPRPPLRRRRRPGERGGACREREEEAPGFEARPGFHVVGHRLALDPSASALQALASHCGAARVAYNWAVRHVLASWSQRAAEETYGVPEAERVAWRSWSLPSLRKAFNEAKHNDPFLREWWAQNSKEAYNTGLANAAAAFDNYVKSRRGERKGAGWADPFQAEAEDSSGVQVHHRHHPPR